MKYIMNKLPHQVLIFLFFSIVEFILGMSNLNMKKVAGRYCKKDPKNCNIYKKSYRFGFAVGKLLLIIFWSCFIYFVANSGFKKIAWIITGILIFLNTIIHRVNPFALLKL
jgi:hypothetical protein